MRNSTVLIIALLALFSLTFTDAAQARVVNLYLGASLGDSVDLSADDLDLSFDDFDVNGDSTSFKFFVGVSLGRIFGVEAALHDFGSIDCCEGVADAGFSADVDGISAAVVAGFPIWRLRVFAKLGVIVWEVDGVVESIVGGTSFNLDGEDPMGGVGVDFKLTDHFSVRAEVEVFKVADGSLDMASVGVQFKF